jgi:caffeoyl-CoA O-methyltransferase
MVVYNNELSQYITDLFVDQDSALEQVFIETPQKGLPAISVKPEEGRFLQFLVRACSAKKVVEIGALGGYSGTWIARGLPADGKLITLEKEPRHAEIARENFIRTGVAGQVEVRVGDAHEELRRLAPEGPFDFVFIDADKPGYPDYFAWALENVRLGGVIAAHNAFRGGSIVDSREPDQFTEPMIHFNRQVAAEKRVISTIYPAGDGTVVAVRIA